MSRHKVFKFGDLVNIYGNKIRGLRCGKVVGTSEYKGIVVFSIIISESKYAKDITSNYVSTFFAEGGMKFYNNGFGMVSLSHYKEPKKRSCETCKYFHLICMESGDCMRYLVETEQNNFCNEYSKKEPLE